MFAMIRLRGTHFLRVFPRFFASSSSVSPTPTAPVSKELLMRLRKKTGYSYVNCRKALVEFGPDRLVEAEQWLHKQAKTEGWTKATKVGARVVPNGLVAVLCENHVATIVELNCETDFVARNADFKLLVEDVTRAALVAARKMAVVKHADAKERVLKIDCDPHTLKMNDGLALPEALSQAIGKLKEKIAVTRIQLCIAEEDVVLYGYAHPRDGTGHVDMGQYVSLVAIRRPPPPPTTHTDTKPPPTTQAKIAQQLCQHIIGMRSETLGTAFTREEMAERERRNEEERREKAGKVAQMEADEEGDADYKLNKSTCDETQTTQIDENETALLRQSFMFNPEQTVGEFTAELGMQIVDFLRVQCGDSNKEAGGD